MGSRAIPPESDIFTRFSEIENFPSVSRLLSSPHGIPERIYKVKIHYTWFTIGNLVGKFIHLSIWSIYIFLLREISAWNIRKPEVVKKLIDTHEDHAEISGEEM